MTNATVTTIKIENKMKCVHPITRPTTTNGLCFDISFHCKRNNATNDVVKSAA